MAFTLIELLVVIAIIAILIGLLAAGRAEGPRGRHPDDLHEQPQAAHAGHAQLRVGQRDAPAELSSSGRSRTRGTEPAINSPWPNHCAGFHWSYLILPYIEQDNLYRTIPFAPPPPPPTWQSGPYLALLQTKAEDHALPVDHRPAARTTTTPAGSPSRTGRRPATPW